MTWYYFKTKDGKVKGLVPATSEQEIARFAGYPVEELVITVADMDCGIIRQRKGEHARRRETNRL